MRKLHLNPNQSPHPTPLPKGEGIASQLLQKLEGKF